MPAYHLEYSQTATPIAYVTIHNPTKPALATQAMMLLDTGADLTLLPQIAVFNTGIEPIPDFYEELMAFDERKLFVPVVSAVMQLNGRSFKGEFPLIEQSIGIIGRNVLNLLPILFDGHRLTWEILPYRNH
jgi:predicted aspartyl protease